MAKDLETILNHRLVKEATYEKGMGFGTGILKDGRHFIFGRANGCLTMDIYNIKEDMENGYDANEVITLAYKDIK